MSNRFFAKTYESFLEKIAIGVIGVNKAIEELKALGHNPLPVEKGTTSFKIWTSLKTKRFRVPDILCLKCGRRFEVRSKTKPELSMSHSTADTDRAWDYGLSDEDYVVFVTCQKYGSEPINWIATEPIQFVSVADMRSAWTGKQAYLTASKGREEAFEKRLIWPTKFAKKDGKVLNLDKSSIELLIGNKRRKISLQIKKRSEEREILIQLTPLIKQNEEFVKNQAIASVVNVTKQIPCDRNVKIDYYIDLLSSASRVDRFIAAKALRQFDSPLVIEALKEKIQDVKEEKLILYEVAVSLLELNDETGRIYINNVIKEGEPHQIHEVIISLCDITPEKSFPIVKSVLENSSLAEGARITAAWALGELGLQEASCVLIDVFNSINSEMKKEAARALLRIYHKHQKSFSDKIIEKFQTSDSKRREGLSWVIGKILKDKPETYFQDVLNLAIDEDSKLWVSYMLGIQNPSDFANKREQIKMRDEKLFFAVNVLWVILQSWIWELKEY
jgi:hypothetical protein